MKSRPGLRTLAAGAALCLIAAGCTNGGSDSAGEPTPVASLPLSPTPTAAGIFEPDEDVVTVAVRDPSTLDPMRLQDPASELVARQLYEGLTAWDPVEEKVLPAAAESWDVSDGGRTFTFHLRQGMTFHDGTPVTSKDFQFAFDRIALKANASDIAFMLERIVGFVEVNQLGDRDHLAGIRTPDDLTLVIQLSEPYQDLPTVLTHPGLVPLSARAVQDADVFTRFPTGNGPFQMAKAWTPGEPVILKDFPGFIQSPDIDGLIFVPYPDAAASWLQFVDGDIDIAEVPVDSLELAEETYGDQGFKSLLLGYYLGFNLKKSNLQSRRVREAVNKAIDRDHIATTIYKGSLLPPRGIVPTGMPGFGENICTELCVYKPDAAKRLIASIPAKKRSVTLEYNRSPGEPHARVARAVKADLEAAGLDVKVKGYRFPEYLKRLERGQQDIYRLGWNAEFPVADEFLTPLFASDSPHNHSGFSSQSVDRLLAEAHGEPSDGRRVQLYIQAEKQIMRQIPIVPIGTFVTHWAVQPDVSGVVFDTSGGFDAADISITED